MMPSDSESTGAAPAAAQSAADSAGTAAPSVAGKPAAAAPSAPSRPVRKPPASAAQPGLQGVAEVLESISDAFFALDDRWRFTYMNTAAERLLQRRRDELLGRNIWAEFPHAVGTVFEQQYTRALEDRVTVEFEEYYPPLETWFAVRAYPTPTGLSVYFQNANERRRAAQALRESEERAREVADRLSFALTAAELGDWEWDAATDLLKLSPRAAEIFGIPAEPTPTRTHVRELIDEQFRDQAREAVEQAHHNNGRYNVEYRINRPDGRQAWVMANGRSRYDSSGKIVGMAGVVQDITPRKLAEEARQEFAQRLEWQTRLFEQIASTTPDFIYIFDLQGRFLYANKRLLQVWGVTYDQAVGKSLYELGYPQWHADMHMRELRQVIETRQSIKGEVPFTGGSGISGVYEYIFSPVLNSDNEVEVIVGTTRDVTDRRKIQEEAQEARLVAEQTLARWQAVVANMAEGLILTDGQGNLIDWNRSALDMHGLSNVEQGLGKLEAVGSRFEMTTVSGEAIPFEEWPISRLLRGDSFHNLELRVRGRDVPMDRIISYSGTAVRDRDGKITLTVLTLHDMTDERLAQQALRESDVQFREMFEQTPIGMTLNDLDGRYLHVNPAYCRIVGYSREQLLGQTLDFRNLIHPEDRPKMLANIRDLLSDKIPAFYLEKRYIRPDGSQVWVRVTGAARRDANGKPIQFVRLVEDINDRKVVEQELAHLLQSERTARSEAERASRMKDEFLATLSHELRTPLNAILGWSQILTSGHRSETDLDEGLRTIERNARAQTQIIEDLLDMSRIISGKIRLQVQRLDLSAVVQAAVETLRPAADAKGVRLQVVLDSHAGPVSGDPNRLQQVFWNLLNNSVKFTPRGGRVQVLLERVNSHLEVSVMDTGEGISPDFLPHVFDRFRQSDASTTRRHGGLGIGLAIVKQLVELHGGTIRAKSPGLGQGATFTVALPLTVMHQEAEPQVARRHPAAGDPPALSDLCDAIAGVKVLVVDDEADARALVKRFLEECKATVLVASSATEALDLLKTERPEVLVSDIGMPGEDGYWLIRQVRALGADKGGTTPAVALTAYARAEDRVKAVMAGFQHHVAKPVEPAELIAMVASLSKRSR